MTGGTIASFCQFWYWVNKGCWFNMLIGVINMEKTGWMINAFNAPQPRTVCYLNCMQLRSDEHVEGNDSLWCSLLECSYNLPKIQDKWAKNAQSKVPFSWISARLQMWYDLYISSIHKKINSYILKHNTVNIVSFLFFPKKIVPKTSKVKLLCIWANHKAVFRYWMTPYF